jgi:hypothetical protein
MKQTNYILFFILMANTVVGQFSFLEDKSKKYKSTTTLNFIKPLLGKLDELDSLKFSSMREYYLLNAKIYDEIIENFEAKYNVENHLDQKNKLKYLFDDLENLGAEDLDKINENIEQKNKTCKIILIKLKQLSTFYMYKYRTEKRFCLIPLRNKYDVIFFDKNEAEQENKSNFFKSTKLSISPENLDYSIFSEVYSDYFHVVKFSIGSVFTTGNSTSNDETDIDTSETNKPLIKGINKLSSGGGNLVLNLAYPICSYTSQDLNFRFNTFVNNRIGIDLPSFNANQKTYPLHFEPNVSSTIYFGGLHDVLAFTTELKIGRIIGNRLFYEQLGIDCKQSFNFNKLSIGIKVNKKFNISMNYFWGDVFVNQNFPNSVSMGLLF